VTVLFGCEDLHVGYGTITVAREVSIAVEPSQILAVLGPNGAGKTSLMLTLAGLLRPISGRLTLDGETLKGGSARRLNQAGVVLVQDMRALFTAMSTVENLEVARRPAGMSIEEVLATFPALAERTKVRAGMLSGGEQQMLALARALVQGPRVLLVDEMSMGLAPIIVEQLMLKLREIANRTEAAVILVEQHVHLALEIADRALVLVHGEVALEGSAASLRDDPSRLQAAYLGVDTVTTPEH
jgi:branched-chain amino acid transport system ATP-binding protein